MYIYIVCAFTFCKQFFVDIVFIFMNAKYLINSYLASGNLEHYWPNRSPRNTKQIFQKLSRI